MTIPTIAERVEQDEITIRSLLVATHDEASRGMWQEWTCVLSMPAYPSDLILAETDDRADVPNEEGNFRGRVFVATEVGMSVLDRDNGVMPNAAGVLQDFCRLAVDVENSDGDFWRYWDENKPEPGALPSEEEYRYFEEWKIHTRNLRVFLGEKYEDYLWKTEWSE